MTNSQVSVVIITYNRADKLSRAINSVLAQSFKDYELIIIDDGSTDNTKDIVNEYIKKNQQLAITYFVFSRNRGIPTARNQGIKLARGEFIAFLDSDDEWLPEKTEKQMRLFENDYDKKIGFVNCNFIVNYENSGNKYKNILKSKDILLYYSSKEKILEELLVSYNNLKGVSESGKIYRKSILLAVNRFDDCLNICDDWDITIRMIINGYALRFLNEILYIYNRHANNSSFILKSRIEKDREYIYIKYKDLYLKNRRIYSGKLQQDCCSYIYFHEAKKAREKILQAIKVYPYNSFFYFQLFFLLFGLNFLNFSIKIKRKLISNNNIFINS